jgi:ribosome maturation factor RimP
MGKYDLPKELLEELAGVAQGEGCELLHVEFKGGVLRLVLDQEDGVTLDHCQQVSKLASAVLDVADYGGGRYTLEVSSPGLDRPLYRPQDYERFAGHLVRLTVKDPETSVRQTLVGRLRGLDDGIVTVIEERRTKRGIEAGESLAVPLSTIEKAQLEVEF